MAWEQSVMELPVCWGRLSGARGAHSGKHPPLGSESRSENGEGWAVRAAQVGLTSDFM